MSRTAEDRLTPAEFGKAIGKSLNTVRKIIAAGEIIVEDTRSPGASIPRYEIPRSEVARWRASRRKGRGSAGVRSALASSLKIPKGSKFRPSHVPEVVH